MQRSSAYCSFLTHQDTVPRIKPGKGRTRHTNTLPLTTHATRKEVTWNILRHFHNTNISEGNFLAKCCWESQAKPPRCCRGRRGQRRGIQKYVCTSVSSQAKPMPANDSRSQGRIQTPVQFLGRPTDFSELWLSLWGGRRGYFHTTLFCEEGARPSDSGEANTYLSEGTTPRDLQVPLLQLQSKDFILSFRLHKRSLWDHLNNFWMSPSNIHLKGYPSLQETYETFFSPDMLDQTPAQANCRIHWSGIRPAFHHFSTEWATDKRKSFHSKLQHHPIKENLCYKLCNKLDQMHLQCFHNLYTLLQT